MGSRVLERLQTRKSSEWAYNDSDWELEAARERRRRALFGRLEPSFAPEQPMVERRSEPWDDSDSYYSSDDELAPRLDLSAKNKTNTYYSSDVVDDESVEAIHREFEAIHRDFAPPAYMPHVVQHAHSDETDDMTDVVTDLEDQESWRHHPLFNSAPYAERKSRYNTQHPPRTSHSTTGDVDPIYPRSSTNGDFPRLSQQTKDTISRDSTNGESIRKANALEFLGRNMHNLGNQLGAFEPERKTRRTYSDERLNDDLREQERWDEDRERARPRPKKAVTALLREEEDRAREKEERRLRERDALLREREREAAKLREEEKLEKEELRIRQERRSRRNFPIYTRRLQGQGRSRRMFDADADDRGLDGSYQPPPDRGASAPRKFHFNNADHNFSHPRAASIFDEFMRSHTGGDGDDEDFAKPFGNIGGSGRPQAITLGIRRDLPYEESGGLN